MPRKITETASRRKKIRSLRKAINLVEQKLADPTDKQIGTLARSLASLTSQLTRLEREQRRSEQKKEPGQVGRPLVHARTPKAITRGIGGRLVAVYEVHGEIIDIPIPGTSSSTRRISKIDAANLTRAKLEEILAQPHQPEPSMSKGEIERLTGLPDTPKPTTDSQAEGPPVPADESAAEEVARIAEIMGGRSNPVPPASTPEATITPELEQQDDEPDIPALKEWVTYKRDRLLEIYSAICQRPQAREIHAMFCRVQAEFLPKAEKLRKSAPDVFDEVLAGYEHILLPPYSLPPKPQIDEVTQYLVHARWEARCEKQKPKPLFSDGLSWMVGY